jgi:hypothetical protein
MTTLILILLIAALICLFLAAVGVASPVNLGWLGLALVVLVFLLEGRT